MLWGSLTTCAAAALYTPYSLCEEPGAAGGLAKAADPSSEPPPPEAVDTAVAPAGGGEASPAPLG